MQLGDHVGDQRAPAGLVRSAEALACAAAEIFVEQEVVAEMRITLHLLVATEDRPPSLRVTAEDVDQAAPQVVGYALQRELAAGADRVLELVGITVELVELL